MIFKTNEKIVIDFSVFKVNYSFVCVPFQVDGDTMYCICVFAGSL